MRDLCKTPGFPPIAGEMSEGQRGIAGRQTPTIPVHTSCAKVPLGETIAKPWKAATRFPSPARRERARVRVTGVDKREEYGKTPLTQSSTTASNLPISVLESFASVPPAGEGQSLPRTPIRG